MTDTRRCVCGATLIPTDQLSVIDTDTVHRHGGPCYVDETRTDVVQRARQALDGSWEGEYAIGRLIGDLADEVEKQRAAIMRTIAACVEADVESIAFNREPGVIKTTTIRSALNGGSDEH